jgi:hypothetical protein
MMRAYTATYRLQNGATGSLTLIVRDSCSAVLAMLEQFGDQLRSISVRPS